jgi:hypothetical protein
MRRHATHRTPQRLTLFSSRPRTKQDATIHYGTLEGGHRTRTSLGQSPQLNWRLPRIATKAPQRLGNLHNLIGGPKYMPQRPLSRLGFQEPKSNKLTTSTYRISEENSNRCTKCNGKSTQSAQILLSQILPKQQMLWRNMRGRTKEINK